MGTSFSYSQCFSKDFQQLYDPLHLCQSEPFQIPPSIPDPPFKSPDPEPVVQETEAISKSEIIDKLSKAVSRFLSETEKEPESFGYKKASTQGSLSLFIKDQPNGYSLLSVWKCDIEASKIAKFLQLVERRKDWDLNISECKKICDVTENIGVYYTLYKRFLMLAPRDTLIVSQNSLIEKGYINVSTSVNYDIVPQSPSIVRAQIELAGYLIETIEKDDQGNTTKVTSINDANFGQSLSINLVKSTSLSLAPNYVKSMIEAIKKLDLS